MTINGSKACVGPGLRATYSQGYFDGGLATAIQGPIDFIESGFSDAVPALAGRAAFSAQWTGWLVAARSGAASLGVNSDDGAFVRLEGANIVDNWREGPARTNFGRIPFSLEAGRPYAITVDYFQVGGGKTMQLFWSAADGGDEIIPAGNLFADRPDLPAPTPTWDGGLSGFDAGSVIGVHCTELSDCSALTRGGCANAGLNVCYSQCKRDGCPSDSVCSAVDGNPTLICLRRCPAPGGSSAACPPGTVCHPSKSGGVCAADCVSSPEACNFIGGTCEATGACSGGP